MVTNTIRVSEPTYHALQSICLNLREVDAVEIYNLRPHDSWRKLAMEAWHMMTNEGRGVVAWIGPHPVATVGFVERWPGTWEIMMFGTDDLPKVALPLMQWARKQIKDLVANHGGRRLQCDSRMGHDEAHKFLRALGAVEEGPPQECFGADGSSYQRFVWIWGRNSEVAENA